MVYGQADDSFPGISRLGADLRKRKITAEAITTELLQKIDASNQKLSAYAFVDREQALRAARQMDALLREGVDLGPLMGMPIGVKDLFSVDGMPTTAGSRADLSGLVAPEGPFVRKLKEMGCIVLGKTRTTEFAMGTFNLTHSTPWNPIDLSCKRMPGGSSSGSAVAMAAGLCAFSVGGDTGGSVRQPAAFCEVVGYKASAALWPLEGIFPLASTLDSIGLFTRDMNDLGIIAAALGGAALPACQLSGLRIGLPEGIFLDGLEKEVEKAFENVVDVLRESGAVFKRIELPGTDRVAETFGCAVPAEFLGFFGRDRFMKNRDLLDPVVWTRASAALDYPADSYLNLLRERKGLRERARRVLNEVDLAIMPTSPVLPIRTDAVADVDTVVAWNATALRNTQPINLLGLCGVSLPIPQAHSAGAHAVGLQLVCRDGEDDVLLAIASAVETVLRGQTPNGV